MMMALTLLFWVIFIVSGLPNDCEKHGQQLICQHTLPTQIPDNTLEVFILQAKTARYDKHTFGHPSWQNVTKLDITVLDNGETETLDNSIFQNLISLRYLGHHNPNIRKVSKFAFEGLSQLMTLDFSDCTDLDVDSVKTALSTNNTLPKLDSFNLNNVQNKFGFRFNLDSTFWNIVSEKRIKSLSLAEISSVVAYKDMIGKVHTLESVNISSSKIFILSSKDIPSRRNISLELSNIKVVDISYNFFGAVTFRNITNINVTLAACDYPSDSNLIIFSKMDKIYADGISLQETFIDRVYLDISVCNFPIQVLHLANNKIQKLNASLKFSPKTALYELDLSKNGMTYISPGSLLTLVALKYLDLSSNQLFKMESYDEFSKLFSQLENLQNLSLASNKLTYLPESIFDNLQNLKRLDLSQNALEYVSFATRSLKNLVELDLSGNTISNLDPNSMSQLNFLLYGNSSSNNRSRQIKINMENNPYICDCERIQSVKWLLEFQKLTKQQLYCFTGEREVKLDEEAFKISKESCPKTKLIVSSAVSILCGIICIFLALFFLRHQRHKMRLKHTVKKFTEDYQQGRTRERFVAMLSYSSEDNRMTIDYIYNTLEKTLQEMLEVDNDTVGIDFKHFFAGRLIMNEIIRIVENSAVIVFAISQTFCEREWCIREFEEAVTQNKPIILVYLEEVHINAMPSSMQSVHNRYTRAKVRDLGDGNYELSPCAITLCRSIIELATANMAEQRKCWLI